MNDEVSEIIKDLSESILYIVSAVCLIVTTKNRKKKSNKSKRKRK